MTQSIESCMELDCVEPRSAGFTPDHQIRLGKGGRIELDCPCCGGSGEHVDLPGNNPAAMAYGCSVCNYQGYLYLTVPGRDSVKVYASEGVGY